MTRLASSARDYAIARLARFSDPDAVLDEVLSSLPWAEEVRCGPLPEGGIPILRARVALYLRLMRRVEAWERWEANQDADASHHDAWAEWLGWAIPSGNGSVWCYRTEWRFAEAKASYARARPRYPRPLYLDAPPHEPGVTARMRRER